MGNRAQTKGFTLVELMITVAIIGLLASMAIPDFIAFTARARQSEVKANLGGIYTAQVTHFTEKGFFSDDFAEIPWSTEGNVFYTYDLGGPGTEGLAPTLSPDPAADSPGADIKGFTAIAYGNLDSDLTVDTWQINDKKNLQVKKDDSKQ